MANTDEHLLNVTAEELIAFKYSEESFKAFASSIGGKGSAYLGILGDGKFAVKSKDGIIRIYAGKLNSGKF